MTQTYLLTDEDLTVFKTCYEEKNWLGAEICRHFRDKVSRIRTVNRAIKRLADMENIYHQKGSGRPVTKTNAHYTGIVEDLIQSQEEKRGNHSSRRKIATQIGVSVSSVNRKNR